MKNLYIKKEECCGCGACVDACPKGALRMLVDREGFRYPRVDEKLCVDCGRCEQVCPFREAAGNKDAKEAAECRGAKESAGSKSDEEPAGSKSDEEPAGSKSAEESAECKSAKEEEQHVRQYFGVQAKEEKIRYESSSGGMFPVLAGYVLKRQGVVYGASYGKDMKVVHREVRSLKELDSIKRTKYVQSSLRGIYKRAERQLKADRWVLFCGTPCQARGLMLYLKNLTRSLLWLTWSATVRRPRVCGEIM